MSAKTQQRQPTTRAARAIKILSENVGISVTEAKRRAGYSESEANQPQRLTKSKVYRDFLEREGLTSKYLAARHKRMINASRFEMETFEHIKKGRKWIRFTDEQIKMAIEGSDEDPTGCTLMFIKEGSRCRIARFRVPDNQAQSKALDMIYKIRGDFSADRAFEDLANHIMGDAEEKELDNILNKNRSK